MNIKLISIFTLLVIVFVFLHSEADLFAPENDSHDVHDYCEIVKTATTKITKYSLKEILNLITNQPISPDLIDTKNEFNKSLIIFYKERSYSHQKITELYLFDRTFRI
ncbi:hypothetical protein [Rosettibacter firmus]|uniref:hypothetical protein n=1 Tax=Rosettibacter firmus TaxID=3111522 RepID=UPI00336C031C